MSSQKAGIVLALAAVLLAVLLLASGLARVELSPGQPLGGWLASGTLDPGPAPPGVPLNPAVWRAIIIALAMLLPVSLVYVILSPTARRRVIAQVLWITAVTYLAYLWVRQRELAAGKPGPLDGPPGALGTDLDAALPVFVPHGPGWLGFAATVTVLVALAGVGWLAWRRLNRPAARFERLAREAQEAVTALRAGADFKDTVLRCYYEMSQVLSAQRGIERERGMTPREFERRLRAAGLPGPPVERLTTLFESVRYGGQTPTSEQEQQAIAALSAIAEACGKLA